MVDPSETNSSAVDHYQFERWYDLIKGHTTHSIICELSYVDIRSLYNASETIKHNRTGIRMMDNDYKKRFIRNELDYEYLDDSLIDLGDMITMLIGSLGGKALIKLSTVSPKDNVFTVYYDRLLTYLNDHINKSRKYIINKDKWWNYMTRKYIEGFTNLLSFNNGIDAITSLVSSSRINQELTLKNLMSDNETNNINIIIRQWDEKLDVRYEFRCFVYNDRLTAVTQYHKMYVKEIHKYISSFKAKIYDYFNDHIRDELVGVFYNGFYTIDLYCDLDRIFVIEINDPPPVAGSVLFDWDDMNDRNVILNGPYVMRVIESPNLDYEDILPKPVYQYLKEVEENLTSRLFKRFKNRLSCSICKHECKSSCWFGLSPIGYRLCKKCYGFTIGNKPSKRRLMFRRFDYPF